MDEMRPGENAPPIHPNCRCSTAAWEDSDEYEAWLDYLSKGGTTEEWNENGKTAWKNQKKVLENSVNGDILNATEMFRKKSDARKGFKSISTQQFDDMTVEVKKHGAKVERGTKFVEEHLEKNGATASTIGGLLMFRTDACMSEVLEETRHFMQNLRGLNDDKEEPIRTYLNEIDARKYIIGYGGKYTVPRHEIEQAQVELAYYEQLLAEYKEGKNNE